MDFSQLAIFLVIAATFGILAKLIRQPLLIGYLFAGVVLALAGGITDTNILEAQGKIGTTLVLFLLGIEMNIKELPTIGRTAFVTGLGQIVITSVLGLLISLMLGFGLLPSAYIAIALTFSSTIIIVKLLSEKKELNSLYGKISVGYLLIQDLIAILVLIFLTGLGDIRTNVGVLGLIGIKAILVMFSVWLLSKRVLPYLFDRLAGGSSELLFITSTAWALGVASLIAGPVGFNLEIGGFLAGLSLSNLPEHLQIASRTRPLRDFFLTIFFLFLGTKLVLAGDVLSILPAGLILSGFVIIGHPLILFIILGILGYKKRTSFLVGISSAQISEFAFIIMAVGESLGHVTKHQETLIIMVGVITMIVSTYFIQYSDKIYKLISRYLGIFQGKKSSEAALISSNTFKDHVVLIGADRTGRPLSNYLKKKNIPFLVVDFNPVIFRNLTAENTPVLFGDITDAEIMELSNLSDARLLISTIPSVEDNMTILEYIKSLKRKPLTIMVTQTRRDGIKLYEAGATYVIVPEVVAGEHISGILDTYGSRGERLIQAGKSHFDRLIFT